MTTPGYVATSHQIAASTGSPSGPLVEGTKPQSHGNVIPAFSGREMLIAPSLASYFSLTAAPRGDSTTT